MPWHHKDDDEDLFELDDEITVSITETTLVYEVINDFPGMNQQGIISYLRKKYPTTKEDRIIDALSFHEKNGKIKYSKKVHGYYTVK